MENCLCKSLFGLLGEVPTTQEIALISKQFLLLCHSGWS